jgi:hypothetical protein
MIDFKEKIEVQYQPITSYIEEESKIISDTKKRVFSIEKFEALAYSKTENSLARKLKMIEEK